MFWRIFYQVFQKLTPLTCQVRPQPMYMRKFLEFDWLTAMQFLVNTVQKHENIWYIPSWNQKCMITRTTFLWTWLLGRVKQKNLTTAIPMLFCPLEIIMPLANSFFQFEDLLVASCGLVLLNSQFSQHWAMLSYSLHQTKVWDFL